MCHTGLKSDNKEIAAFERSGARSKPPGAVLKIEMLAQRHARCQNGLPLGRRSCDGARATSSVSIHGVKFRGLPATEHFQRRRRSMLVRLSLGRSSLIAGAAQSVGTCDLVPKKRVVSLRTGCCSSPKSSGFRGRRMRSGISGSQTPSSGRRVTRVVREAA